MNEKNNIKTPEETAQAVERMADRLEEMDKAKGSFGEVMTDEELDDVVGGSAYGWKRTLPPQTTKVKKYDDRGLEDW